MSDADAAVDFLVNTYLRGDKPPPGCAIKFATAVSQTGADASIVVDGDTGQVGALSLIGATTQGDRVAALFWPPHGVYIIGATGGAGWVDADPYFTAGWTHFGAPLRTVQFRRDGDYTRLRGVAKRSSGASLTVLTLPAGYAPYDAAGDDKEDFVVETGGGGVSFSVARVDSDGTVSLILGPGAGVDLVSLSGVVFASTNVGA